MSYWTRTLDASGGIRGHATDVAVMKQVLQTVYLARHGETAWSRSGQHTGLTDLPLTDRGEREARDLGDRLKGMKIAKVVTSPLRRAVETCELAGLRDIAQVEPDLVEWDYGKYEGLTSAQIYNARPDWDLFSDGCPGGETPEQVADRADRVISMVRTTSGDVLLFSSGHFLRILAARWLGLEPAAGRYFLLGTASLSALGYEHSPSQPVIRFWDDAHHAFQIARH